MDRTPYQDKIIKRYYDNKDQIMQQKLSDLIPELYLASGKKRIQLWKRVALALENMKVPSDKIAALVAQDKPELLVKYVEK